jgi:hypothetical protein
MNLLQKPLPPENPAAQEFVTDQVTVVTALVVNRLPARHVLDMPGVYQTNPETSFFQDLQHRNPIHPGRFRRNRCYSVPFQPVGEFGDTAANNSAAPISIPAAS